MIRGRNLLLIFIIISSMLYGLTFTSLNIAKYKSLFSFEWEDDAGENQIVYNIATSFTPRQTIFVSKYFFDRFTPIYFFIALFYKICPHVYTWYFLMSFSYGLCSIIVYLLAADILKDKIIAFVISLSYLLYCPLHYVNLAALDGNTFSLPLLFLTLYFLYKKKFAPYAIFAFLSCMCKEDIPLIIFVLGGYQLIRKYPKRWWLSTCVFSALYFAGAVYISNNFLRVKGFSADIAAREFEYLDANTIKGIFTFLFFQTKVAFGLIFTWFNIRVFLMLLFPLLFFPLFSLEMYIPFIMFAEILRSEGFDNQNAYYLAPIIPFLYISLIFTLRKIYNFSIRKKAIYFITLFILIFCFASNFGRNIIGCTATEGSNEVHDERFINVRNIFNRRLYTMDEGDKIAWKFINMIPKNASVTASGDLLFALSSRNVLHEFGLNIPEAIRSKYSYSEYPNYEVDFIIIHKKYMPHGLGGHYAFLKEEYLEDEIKRLTSEYDYSVAGKEGNYILLKKK
ncbi:MAG: DUF2079 domain-containing protein [Candidatus Omnitrophica bacterium]|nr:DUF2079 domain-containing protein [Candidatus Omnitrophota bacterium]